MSRLFNYPTSPVGFKTYATQESAEKRLIKGLEELGLDARDVKYVIIATADGRYKPLLLGTSSSKDLGYSTVDIYHAMNGMCCLFN